ncbi:carbohydrate-binding domain-containing protein [Fusibacter paucivorans]|uniref:Carbohydrate-binding domain-containing protein n=1 Tax=Fusibacter paucivorans TaxID=76009 RepID=A0ABS5PR66_9FIRM|nr:carbohydrate-binding domain-containing protein [Fusibacter paucivorans]MBS7527648.1 carbohydrate-binding domain-containing protein [Fusibacter paucivorans]
MKALKSKKLIMVFILMLSLAGCSAAETVNSTSPIDDTQAGNTEQTGSEFLPESQNANSDDNLNNHVGETTGSAEAVLDLDNMFSDRDLEQTADTSKAVAIALTDGNDVNIFEEGVYVLSGDVENVTVTVQADDEAKVQLVLDGVSITNENTAPINIESADKVFIALVSDENTLSVTGEYVNTTDTNIDAVIFSKSDLVLNGTGSVTISSATANGITSKDDLKITGGTYTIAAALDAVEANDSIRIYDGIFIIDTGKDAFHSENDDDLNLGYMYIKNGNFTISAADDGMQANSIMQIDGGDIDIITSTEGIEATFVRINGGNIDIYATDDGINASDNSDYTVAIEVNGGNINVEVGPGDTDGFDANGTITINGGTIAVTANSAFDADVSATLNGGDVTVNGETVTELPTAQRGGGGGGKGTRPEGAPTDAPTDGRSRTPMAPPSNTL